MSEFACGTKSEILRVFGGFKKQIGFIKPNILHLIQLWKKIG